MKKVMKEFKSGKLHSGSKNGPVVKNKKQAVAIAISEAKKKGNRPASKFNPQKYEATRKKVFQLAD